MADERIVFSVLIADVPVEIRCRYKQNKAFFREYITEAAPLYSVEPQEEDLIRMRDSFVRLNEREGKESPLYQRWFLENSAIHDMLADAVAREGVILMHGSALSMDGEAYIFTAPSGTGKSTHTRLWREAFGERCFMINDDKPMLRLAGGRFRVYGTPWNGKHGLGRNCSAPLRAIVSLTRDTHNHIEPLSKAEAFQVLMRQVYSPGTVFKMQTLLELETALINSTDFFVLGCNMEAEAAIIAYRGIVGGSQ